MRKHIAFTAEPQRIGLLEGRGYTRQNHPWFSINEICQLFPVERHSVAAFIRAGKLKAHRFSERKTYVSYENLEKWADSCRVGDL